MKISDNLLSDASYVLANNHLHPSAVVRLANFVMQLQTENPAAQASANPSPAIASPFPQGIELAVCSDIAARQELGVRKYGQTVADNPLTHSQWLQHAYEEALDLAVYLKRAMKELE
jgi:hypothetical protein